MVNNVNTDWATVTTAAVVMFLIHGGDGNTVRVIVLVIRDYNRVVDYFFTNLQRIVVIHTPNFLKISNLKKSNL